jgi:AraC-like DNA-binding protein
MVQVTDCVSNRKKFLKKIDYHWYLDQFMEEKKPYLKPSYSLKEMGVQTGINVPALSAFINLQYQMNFNEYINMHRVKHFKILLHLPNYHHWTLEAIAYEAGFNSRTTFIRSFTKFSGCSPSEYLKSIKSKKGTNSRGQLELHLNRSSN